MPNLDISFFTCSYNQIVSFVQYSVIYLTVGIDLWFICVSEHGFQVRKTVHRSIALILILVTALKDIIQLELVKIGGLDPSTLCFCFYCASKAIFMWIGISFSTGSHLFWFLGLVSQQTTIVFLFLSGLFHLFLNFRYQGHLFGRTALSIKMIINFLFLFYLS